MRSAIYEGWIRHRRFHPVTHAFTYRALMFLLDLDELDTLGDRLPLFSTDRPAPIRFRRSDHWGSGATPLKVAILDLVEERIGSRPEGDVRILTQPRFWGFGFNPISVYYCLDASGEALEATVAEVTNTPWKEVHCYVLPAGTAPANTFEKSMHVSPFMGMSQEYRWYGKKPRKTAAVHLEAYQDDVKLLDATLSLRHKPLNNRALAACLLKYPLASASVVAAIHWEALKLFLKGVPMHRHPAKGPRDQSRPDEHPLENDLLAKAKTKDLDERRRVELRSPTH